MKHLKLTLVLSMFVAVVLSCTTAAATNTQKGLVTISLSERPFSRVVFGFTSTKGQYVEVEFNPGNGDPLVKSTVLTDCTGPTCNNWSVSAYSEPLYPASSRTSENIPWVNLAWRADNTEIKKLNSLETKILFTRTTCKYLESKVDSSGKASNLPKIDCTETKSPIATITLGDLPSLKDAAGSLSSQSGNTVAGRSLSTALPAALADTASIMAELALERAKSRTRHIALERLTDLVCEKATLPRKIFFDELPEYFRREFEDSSGQGAFSPISLLPSSCAAVQNLTLDDLTAARKTLQLALQKDLIQLGTAVAKTKIEKNDKEEIKKIFTLLRPILAFVATTLSDDGKLDSQEAQLLMIEISRAINDYQSTTDSKWAVNGAKLAFAVMASCHARNDCDTRRISDMIWNPEHHFTVPDKFEDKIKTLKEKWPNLPQFVARGLRLLDPPRDATPVSMAHDALDLGFDILEKIRLEKDMGNDKREILFILAQLREIAHGSADQDRKRVVAAAIPLVGVVFKDKENGSFRALSRAAKAAVALSSYAMTYADAQKITSEEDKKALREARKAQLQNFMEEFASRNDRWGETIVSLGAPVGFGSYFQFDGKKDKVGRWAPPQLSMPVGVGIDNLPKRKWGANPRNETIGAHFQIAIADLTQYLAYDTENTLKEYPPPYAVLSPGVQIAMTFGPSPDDLFCFGLDARYLPPNLLEANKGAFRLGLFLAYYVPFFDFN